MRHIETERPAVTEKLIDRKRLCQYAVLRYVPDEVRQEFINIGLVLHSPKDQFLEIKWALNDTRILAFDQTADIDLLRLVLEGINEIFSQGFNSSRNDLTDIYYLKKAISFFNNQLQFSPIYQTLSDNPLKELETLFEIYISK